MKSGNLNFLEPSEQLQACNGTAFLNSSIRVTQPYHLKFINFCLYSSHPGVYVIFNKMLYSVLTQPQYISFLATCFGFYQIIFRPMLTIGRYTQCVHKLWDPIVFT